MENQASRFAVLLAGGSGTRFWPKSRIDQPKQLCAIGSEHQTMIEQTLRRLDSFIDPTKRIIVTHQRQSAKTEQIAGDLCGLVLQEPQAKNTAAALALAAIEIKQRDPNAIMICLHADHLIEPTSSFLSCVDKACDVAQSGKLCLIGIPPSYPETGYGYIERGLRCEGNVEAFHVDSFREKPDAETASQYITQGNFLWNSGIFTWRVETICEEFEKYLPETFRALSDLASRYGSFGLVPWNELQDCYGELKSVPIDDAILEKSERVAVIDATFRWQDVGSWAALSECYPANSGSNLHFGDGVLIDCDETTVDSDGPFVAAIGLKGLVVVAHKGAILVCPKERAQDVKKVVEHLKEQDRPELL